MLFVLRHRVISSATRRLFSALRVSMCSWRLRRHQLNLRHLGEHNFCQDRRGSNSRPQHWHVIGVPPCVSSRRGPPSGPGSPEPRAPDPCGPRQRVALLLPHPQRRIRWDWTHPQPNRCALSPLAALRDSCGSRVAAACVLGGYEHTLQISPRLWATPGHCECRCCPNALEGPSFQSAPFGRRGGSWTPRKKRTGLRAHAQVGVTSSECRQGQVGGQLPSTPRFGAVSASECTLGRTGRSSLPVGNLRRLEP